MICWPTEHFSTGAFHTQVFTGIFTKGNQGTTLYTVVQCLGVWDIIALLYSVNAVPQDTANKAQRTKINEKFPFIVFFYTRQVLTIETHKKTLLLFKMFIQIHKKAHFF
jgi:hypothetical protein